MKPITELRNKHQGYDIHVVASGASTQFIDKSYFDNKITIGVNEVWRRFDNLDYIVHKEQHLSDVLETASKQFGFKVIVSKYRCGTHSFGTNKEKADYYFDHKDNKLTDIDLDVVGTDQIVVSYSTITSAIHIAAYMGAANIILVGHDCGTLDGKQNYNSYPEPIHTDGRTFYRKFLTKIEPQTIALRERLKEVYGCNLYSLNPFVNFGLEGHIYER